MKARFKMVASNADPSFHDADLTRGMEHMRPYVSVERPSDNPSNDEPPADVYGVPGTAINPVRRAPQRPTSPSNTEKRVDPFQFGSRYLEEGDNIFEFNAWDHVEVDEAFKEFAEDQYARQRADPVSDFDRTRINATPAKPWNRFYKQNAANFFKNRKWLFQEFPVLASATAKPPDGERRPITILEIGAGAGNTAFPILAANQNPDFKLHALDFSSSAVEVMRKDPAYDEKVMQADVWDLGGAPEADADSADTSKAPLRPSIPPNIEPGSIDVAVLVFTLSALAPDQWAQALLNVWTVLKPGGEVLFRDYGRGDLAQVRFKKGRWLAENFYVRGDGTRVYFFDEDELRGIWQNGGRLADEGVTDDSGKPSFEVLDLGTDRRMLVNRKRKLKMYRCWMQGRFRKPL